MFLRNKQYFKDYDPGAAYVYGRLGSPDGLPVPGKWGVETAGSSTTVTASAGTPFAPLETKLGSIIVFMTPRPDGKIVRRVTGWTSATQIAVDTAVNLPAGTAWFWYPFDSGTAADDGWHLVSDLKEMTVYADLTTLASTSIDVRLEAGGGPFSTPVILSTTNLSGVGKAAIAVDPVVQSLRVGLLANGNAAGDVISVWLEGRQRLAA